jgi:hypothetical protein
LITHFTEAAQELLELNADTYLEKLGISSMAPIAPQPVHLSAVKIVQPTPILKPR